MDQTFLVVILVMSTVVLAVWAAMQFFGNDGSGTGASERKKLYQRLVSEGRPGVEAEKAYATVRREVQLTGMSGKLVRLPGMAAVHHALEQTWPSATLAKFLASSVGLGFVGFILAIAFFGSLLLGTAGLGLGAGAPFLVLNSRRAKRQRLMSEQLPEAMDFLGRVLRAGHSLSTGLQMVGQELPEPLAGEFRRAYDAHSLGRTLDDALKETSTRIASTDFGFFVTAVLIQRQTGGDLSEVLDNISEMVRSRLRLQQHVQAKTAEGRFTGYILTAFPIVMFLLSYALNPAYAGTLLHGTGLYLLCTAFGLCGLGLICIRRLTTVKV